MSERSFPWTREPRVARRLPREGDPSWPRGARWCALLEAWGFPFETTDEHDVPGRWTTPAHARDAARPLEGPGRDGRPRGRAAFAVLEAHAGAGLIGLCRWPAREDRGPRRRRRRRPPDGRRPRVRAVRGAGHRDDAPRRVRRRTGSSPPVRTSTPSPGRSPPGAEYYNHSFSHPYSYWEPARVGDAHRRRDGGGDRALRRHLPDAPRRRRPPDVPAPAFPVGGVGPDRAAVLDRLGYARRVLGRREPRGDGRAPVPPGARALERPRRGRRAPADAPRSCAAAPVPPAPDLDRPVGPRVPERLLLVQHARRRGPQPHGRARRLRGRAAGGARSTRSPRRRPRARLHRPTRRRLRPARRRRAGLRGRRRAVAHRRGATRRPRRDERPPGSPTGGSCARDAIARLHWRASTATSLHVRLGRPAARRGPRPLPARRGVDRSSPSRRRMRRERRELVTARPALPASRRAIDPARRRALRAGPRARLALARRRRRVRPGVRGDGRRRAWTPCGSTCCGRPSSPSRAGYDEDTSAGARRRARGRASPRAAAPSDLLDRGRGRRRLLGRAVARRARTRTGTPSFVRRQAEHVAALARRWRGDPAIVAWDLTDEPPLWIFQDTTDDEARAWTRRAHVDALREVDPGHLVTIGTSGQEIGHGPFRADVVADLLDFACVHPYPIYQEELYPDALLSPRMTHRRSVRDRARGGRRPARDGARVRRLLCAVRPRADRGVRPAPDLVELRPGRDRLLRVVLDRCRAGGVPAGALRAPAARDAVRRDRPRGRAPPARSRARGRRRRASARSTWTRWRRTVRPRRAAAIVVPHEYAHPYDPDAYGLSDAPAGPYVPAETAWNPRRDVATARARMAERVRAGRARRHLRLVPARARRRRLARRRARAAAGAAHLDDVLAAARPHELVAGRARASRPRRRPVPVVLGGDRDTRDGRARRMPHRRPGAGHGPPDAAVRRALGAVPARATTLPLPAWDGELAHPRRAAPLDGRRDDRGGRRRRAGARGGAPWGRNRRDVRLPHRAAARRPCPTRTGRQDRSWGIYAGLATLAGIPQVTGHPDVTAGELRGPSGTITVLTNHGSAAVAIDGDAPRRAADAGRARAVRVRAARASRRRAAGPLALHRARPSVPR